MSYARLYLFVLLFAAGWTAAAAVHHQLRVTLEPGSNSLRVEDRIRLPEDSGRHLFVLHRDMSPELAGENGSLTSLGGSGILQRYLLIAGAGEEVVLRYGGRIRHDMQEVAESVGRSHRRSAGSISEQGVFLDGVSAWHPRFADHLQTFELTVLLPKNWLAVSQGSGPNRSETRRGGLVEWVEKQPQDDIYLIAAPFSFYELDTPAGKAQVFLREADDALAKRYLQATAGYLELYSKLLGDYPYEKFALVENFWATGYGMPSFTLLGSQVIRLPFILYTSYPHEVLHNWWGNGVYVDYDTGNWSEGLTTYLADHLLKEQRGGGSAYRRDALQRFADYVRQGEDFPLADFRGRHSSASQSVGYGKGFMFFHMLRRQLGDAVFVDGLRRFYRDKRFQTAGYADLKTAFEQASGQDLSDYFKQWLERTGAPMLALSGVVSGATDNGYRISGVVKQSGDFRLRVPLLVQQENGETLETSLVLTDAEQPFNIETASRPLRLDLDPRFDLFRGLYPEESPPTFGALFGSERGLILLPSAAPEGEKSAYEALARAWTKDYSGWSVQWDSEEVQLPNDRPVWLLGWENRHLDGFAAALSGVGVDTHSSAVHIDGKTFPRDGNSVVLAMPGVRAQPIAWLGAANEHAIGKLTRKLPHYGKYGQLVFAGDAARNTHKAQWPVRSSPLSVVLAPGGEKLSVTPLRPLTALISGD